MRKCLWLVPILLLLLLPVAVAETYTFDSIHAQLTIPDGVYDVVLTQDNVTQNTGWLTEQGIDPDAYPNYMQEESILLEAHDLTNGRVFVLTAKKNTDADNYFNLNQQDEEMRRFFRVSHTDGSAYGILGFTYTSAVWKNYGDNVLRFLQTKYSLSEGGEVKYSGYQRRTINNGYTITLDMQVPAGRAAKDADEKALEKIMTTFKFTTQLPMPPVPVKLILSSAIPRETNDANITIKGTTGSKANVEIKVTPSTSGDATIYNVTATSSGAFSQAIKLPAQGTYSIRITATKEGALENSSAYPVSYNASTLPVSITSEPASVLGDSTVIAGTTLSGAKVQLSVTGPVTIHKTDTGPNFSFKIDTSAEGEYVFSLTIEKKGLAERHTAYKGTRAYDESDRQAKIKDTAKKPAYSTLKSSTSKYINTVVTYTAYIVSIEETFAGQEWVYRMALTKNKDTYKDIIYMRSYQAPLYAEGTQVKFYGTVVEDYITREDNGDGTSKTVSYPKVEFLFFDQ